MVKVLFLDIETLPTTNQEYIEEIKQEAQEKRPAQNVKKEVKDFWDEPYSIEGRFQEAYRKTALDVLWAELLCIGYAIDDGPASTISRLDPLIGDETKLLETFNGILGQINGDTIIVGHNLKRFDYPIIKNRFIRNRVKPPEYLLDCYIYDTMLNTPCSNGLGMVSMNDACVAYGLGKAKTYEWQGQPFSGARVYDAFKAGEFELISEYCTHDIVMLRKLFNVLTFEGSFGIRNDNKHIITEEITKIYNIPGISPLQKLELIVQVLNSRGLLQKAA